ncbi:MAG: hypothetical protein FWE95_07715, partial [Planctomycetaceae bacterium]|nr:hypothetical protein [Planctomycetaceae bacterium]
MLNNFKIGTKLFSGFVIVLVILIAVGLVGWWAIIKKTEMAGEVAAAEALITAGLSMQRDVLFAQVASNNETLTREQEYANEVERLTKQIIEEHKDDIELMKYQKSKDTYKELLGKVAEFGKSDANSWRVATAQKDVRTRRQAHTTHVIDNLHKLEDHFNKLAKNQPADAQSDAAEDVLPYGIVASRIGGL